MGVWPEEWREWKDKIREGYVRMVETLWEVANEIDVRGEWIAVTFVALAPDNKSIDDVRTTT